MLFLVPTFNLLCMLWLTHSSSEVPSFFEKVASAGTLPPPKAVVSNATRLLFVAGLEGSGHHGIADMMKLCTNVAFCKREDLLSAYSVSYDNNLQRSVGLFAGGDGSSNHANMQRMLDRMGFLANHTSEFTRTLHYLGLSDEKASTGVYPGMLSYPNGPSPHKTLDRPDLFALAALAETAQLDIRFLVLIRNAESSLRSTVDNRNFGSMQPQVLVASAEALYAQMRLVSGSFYKCVNYEDLVYQGLTVDQKRTLVDFLHPHVIEHNSGLMDQMLGVVYKGGGDGSVSEHTSTHTLNVSHVNMHRINSINRAYHVLQLQNRLNLVKLLCTKKNAWI